MPIKSKSQWRALHAKAKRGEISEETLEEFKRKTKTPYRRLPERKSKGRKR